MRASISVVVCLAGLLASASAFTTGFFGVSSARTVAPRCSSQTAQTPRMLFGGGAPAGGADAAAAGDKKGEGFNMGNMMEGLKKANEIGQKTKELQKTLEATEVVGASDCGKVKVTVTGQQMPKGCDIDPAAYEEGIEALQEKVVVAMSRAHTESLSVMSRKLAELYQDMGLPLGAGQAGAPAK